MAISEIVKSTTKKRICKSPTTLHVLSAYNPNSADCWVYAYDTNDVASVTVGTTAPAWQMLVPGGSTDSRGANSEAIGLYFKNGIVLGVKTVANAAPGTNLEVVAAFN